MKGTDDETSHAIFRRSSSGTSERKEVALEVRSDTGMGFDCFVQCKVLQIRPARVEV
jgi:hypothetical protein